jgi:ribose transport system ATP-binding protein
MSETPMIEFSDIGRSFFGVEVLKGVTFRVKPGQTVGIVGENGAGKSTLMNILGGNLSPDNGGMRLNGRPYAPASPRDAERAGVAFIHQELNLFPNLSIAENIFLRNFPWQARWLPFIARRQINERTGALLKDVQLAHPPHTLVEQLSAGERQLVEIAKALASDARLIIFDEPTTSLTAHETERLFAIMGQLRERGISMIYISHNLGHVLELADEIVVLRDGQVVEFGATPQFNPDRLVSLMVGREITQLYPPRDTRPTDQVVLDVRGVMQPGIVRNITFQLRRGEIVGISGLMGSGRSELARILFGLDACASGEIRLDGEPLQGLTPRERIRRGLAFLTEDRRAEGLCLEASIGDNITLPALSRFARTALCLVDRQKCSGAVLQMREAVRLTPTARDAQAVKTLSGGNQQKVVLAKWLLNEPKVFILDEPTRGIDVGAKHEVYRLINALAGRSAAILMISSEVEELIGMCDRILVMRAGEIRDVIQPQEFDRERILRAAIHQGELP